MSPQEFLRTLLFHRRLVLANALGVAFLAAVISLLLPKWYLGRATVLPPEERSSEFSLLTAAIAQAPILANFASTGTPSEIVARILESRTVRGRVVEENDLLEVYEAKNMEQAIRVLDSRTGISVTPEGLVSIRVMARTPERAAAIANSYLDALDEFNREQRVTAAKKTRLFIEGRLAETKVDLARAEEALRKMEEQNSSVELKEQTRAAIEAASGLLSEIAKRQVELGVLRQELTSSHPSVRRLEDELSELRGQLDGMIRAQAEGDSASLYVPFRSVPTVKMRMIRLTRDLELQNRLYALLTEQYEQARIQEMRDTPTIQVLDRATPPVRRAKPRRTLVVLSGLGLGLLAGIVVAFGAEGGRAIGGTRRFSGPPPSVREDLADFGRLLRRGLASESPSEDRE
ncbi:MAG: hypothetical protein FJY88_08065 [Candidatus Eisenbacteria bacterium]|nr:hypothetical protein [Candidatus Eisenbacteria bacterium]